MLLCRNQFINCHQVAPGDDRDVLCERDAVVCCVQACAVASFFRDGVRLGFWEYQIMLAFWLNVIFMNFLFVFFFFLLFHSILAFKGFIDTRMEYVS